MSRIFGPARQIGYVVDDLDSAIDRWLALGVGPFFRMNGLKTNYFRVGGQDVPLNLDVGIANSGDMQIELIYQHDRAPTPYRRFLDRHGPGMHHLSVWSHHYDQAMADLHAIGRSPSVEGEVHVDGSTGIRFAYFEPAYEPETMIEIADSATIMGEFNKIIRNAAIDWDGSDPVRVI
ncbi:VOC family protein [Sphingobium sp. HWE2-09]|uniref:VOC family protein n=1 Tax=Sphingobium sp. HWE2-09 TaxID=3108390 RepID=UPI002DCDB9F2|nr:VOC family protein [Sphingobium sp. HWE2-09]